MASGIDSTLLTVINENYPVAGFNNSSQGFRDNFANIKTGLTIAGKELTYIGGKKIEIIGDATGISGEIGLTNVWPTAINLVLADTGVTVGTYDTTNNILSVTVDSKGRVTGLSTTPIPTRPSVVGSHTATNVETTYAGNTSELTVPSFDVDEYGTITGVGSETFEFGLEGHALAKGNIIVGHETDGAKALPMPAIVFNPNDAWVLAWRPNNPDTSPNPMGLAWFKLPAPPPVNPAQVISVVAGEGIEVSTNPTHPEVKFAFTSFPEYPTGAAIQTGSKLLMRDSATNQDYQIDIAKIFSADPDSGNPLFAVKDDPAPELGGDLTVGNNKIIANKSNGLVLEIRNARPFMIRNVQTLDPNYYNPNDPNMFLELPESDWVVKEQKFPPLPPTFSAADTSAGIDAAFLKSKANGQMYWSNELIGNSGVQEITPGVGIAVSPIGGITDTGTISLDFSNAPIQFPDIDSDMIVAMDPNRSVYRAEVKQFIFDMPNVRVVDPQNGSTTMRPSLGRLNDPFSTIDQAVRSIPEGSPDLHYILLLPGIYNESLTIDRANVQIISLMGPETVKVRGDFTILADMGQIVFRGINFDFSNILDNPAERILTALDGIDSLKVEDCWFYTDDTDYGRANEIIKLQGVQKDQVHFNNCKFNGKFINNLIPEDITGFIDYRVRITNTITDMNYLLTVEVGNQTLTQISNIDLLKQAIHIGGTLELSNVSGFIGDWSDALWASIDPDVDDLASLGYPTDGIQSSATFTADGTNSLILQNVSMRGLGNRDVRSRFYSTIQKTGTCNYIFSNVDRMPPIDSIVGNRELYSGVMGVDIPETVKNVTLTGNYSLRISESRTWDLTLNSNSIVSFVEDSYLTDTSGGLVNAYANSITVMIRQGSSGSNTIQFNAPGGIIWPDGAGQPTTATGAGNISVFTFLRVGSTWLGSRSFNQA